MNRIGVLSLQGDVREHLEMVASVGATPVSVKTLTALASVDGLILPGGESTTISKLARIFDLLVPLREAISGGLPTFGTCAGLILLADRIVDGIEGQETFGGLDVTVQRNAFGHQTDSFETGLTVVGIDGDPVKAAFIRAPIIQSVGSLAEPIASLDDGRIVAVRQDSKLGISFHPEICGEPRMHEFFLREFIQRA